jgi:hypothetical protein
MLVTAAARGRRRGVGQAIHTAILKQERAVFRELQKRWSVIYVAQSLGFAANVNAFFAARLSHRILMTMISFGA